MMNDVTLFDNYKIQCHVKCIVVAYYNMRPLALRKHNRRKVHFDIAATTKAPTAEQTNMHKKTNTGMQVHNIQPMLHCYSLNFLRQNGT